MPARTVLTIGNFDGVHLGHAALVRRARALADAGAHPGRVIALAFSPHPMTVLAPARVPALLSTFDHRADLLRALGADAALAIEPTPEMLARTPDEFVRWLVERYNPAAIVEGTDFHFGRARAGSVRTLADLGAAHGFAVDIVPPVEVALTDQTIVTASSTIARWLIGHGRMRDAALVLGRPYALTGTVVRGDRRGRTLGFPTANLRTAQAIPGDGVYAGTAVLADGRRFQAAVHVGPRATFDSSERTVEAHILDWAGPLAEGTDEYGWPLTIECTAWVRGQARFDSADALVAQIARDVSRVRTTTDAPLGMTPQEVVA
jgi:riboflavin kinase/FMN adenylyltransferase